MKNSFKKYLSLARVSEKWKKLTSTSQKSSFHEFIVKRLLPPNFKIFIRALNETMLCLLHRKFISTSQNEEFVKKTFPQGGNCFHCLEYLTNKKNGFSLARKTDSYRSNELCSKIHSLAGRFRNLLPFPRFWRMKFVLKQFHINSALKCKMLL